MLPRKNDVIIAMHALQRLLGDELIINLRIEKYIKTLREYAKFRES